MHVFTRRNAVIGWIATRIARKRVERRLNAVAGNSQGRRWLALGAALAGVAVTAGALVARRATGAGTQAA
jgi:hypothetical protein